MNRPHRPTIAWLAVLVAVAGVTAALVGAAGPAGAALQQAGKTARVVLGADNDNGANTFIQPAGVQARQHLENADVMVGSRFGELLLGRKGSDVIDAGYGKDIIMGGLDAGAPNSDVIFGGWGNDYNIWAPGDGNDAFLGGPGIDVHINSAVEQANGEVALFKAFGRTIPHALIDNQTASCSVEAVPSEQGLGFDYITRFLGANGNVIVTIRLKDVELLVCNSAKDNMARFAVLQGPNPQLVERPLSTVRGTLLGAILGA